METIYIRELVAWVLVIGLVVTLVNLKMKEKPKSSKPSRTKVSQPVVPKEEEIPFIVTGEPTDEEIEELKTLEADLDQESGRENKNVASVPKQSSRSRQKRGRTDKVPGSSDRTATVRSGKTTVRHGSAPHKGKKRTS